MDAESRPIDEIRGSSGETLGELSAKRPTLAVFLRHAGCPFCRETLSHLQTARSALEEAGIQPAIVHMMPESQAAPFVAGYDLSDVPRFSDPDRSLYRACGLERGGVSQVMGPAVWWRGFKATVLGGHLPGVPQGDVFQLAGAALLDHGQIVRAQRAQTSAEAVNFDDFTTCPLPTGTPPAVTK